MLNSTWKFLGNVPSDWLHLKLPLVRSPGECWVHSRLRNAPGEGDMRAQMVGLGTLAGGVQSPLPFSRRGVGGQGDWFSVGGRKSASPSKCNRIRPIEVMSESELTEPVVRNERRVQWGRGLWATEQSWKSPYRWELQRWAPQRAGFLKFFGLPTCIERMKLAHPCIFFLKRDWQSVSKVSFMRP